tara:strand:- start:194 stop:1012 length:819 start_codon:yes stop_codon:yes gene_type:complete
MSTFLFAQSGFRQAEIKILTTMDIAYAGKIFLNTTQRVSDGIYLEEVVSEYEKFYVRVFAGGNKTVGKILDRKNETLTMYDKSKKKYSEEIFEQIRNNKGIPLLKDITKLDLGNNSGRSGSTTSSTSNQTAEPQREIEQTISKDHERINNFDCKKIVTVISSVNGSVRIEEWVTTDTAIFSYVENELRLSVTSFNGEYKKSRGSSDWIKAIDPEKSTESISGEVIKSIVSWKNDKGDTSFSMMREVLSAKIIENDPTSYMLPDKFKKVANLD